MEKTRKPTVTWHDSHLDKRSFGDIVADAVAAGMGSWTFIIVQTVLVVVWMVLNVIGFVQHWDVYPFILLNLLFSTQAAYAAPIIMMSQNRAGERDRANAMHDLETNIKAELLIEKVNETVLRIETEHLEQLTLQVKRLAEATLALLTNHVDSEHSSAASKPATRKASKRKSP